MKPGKSMGISSPSTHKTGDDRQRAPQQGPIGSQVAKRGPWLKFACKAANRPGFGREFDDDGTALWGTGPNSKLNMLMSGQ